MAGSMDFSGASGPNMYVWKVFVGESSSLANADDVSSMAPAVVNAGSGAALLALLFPRFVV